jgi:aflatoxin B1 aldehyde reductase
MNTILGTMNIEYPYSSKQNSVKEYSDIINKYISSVKNPILDTAYYYGNTKTEQILGDILNNIDKKPIIATKANPWFNNDFTNGVLGQLSKNNLERQINTSLVNLKVDYIDIYYLHCYDYETPLIETLEKCDELWRKEKFNKFGISNFSKDQMQDVLKLCDNNLLNEPSYYQGMYNLISRKIEDLFPLLGDHNIEFWGYNPLAGGLLTGKYQNNNLDNDSRFKNNKIYQNIFWKEEILEKINNFYKAELNKSKAIEYSYVWLNKYSKMRINDKIIIGVSDIKQLENNLSIFKNNTDYDNNIINDLNNLYNGIEDISPNYYY